MVSGTSVSSLSSGVAVKLLKALEAVEKANQTFTDDEAASKFDAVSKASMSSGTLFSIIENAASLQQVTAPQQQASAKGTLSERDVPAGDPHDENDYTIEQAGARWFAALESLAASLANTPGQTSPGETNGQIIAATMDMTGDKAASFALAFDNGTLSFAAMNTLPSLGATCTRTFIRDGSGLVVGSTTVMNCDEPAMQDYTTAHPNMIWGDDCGAQGSGGLSITW